MGLGQVVGSESEVAPVVGRVEGVGLAAAAAVARALAATSAAAHARCLHRPRPWQR